MPVGLGAGAAAGGVAMPADPAFSPECVLVCAISINSYSVDD
jgi:hypothetical protein